MPEVIARLRAERVAIDLAPRQIVREVSYAGDEGGILCHIEPEEGHERLLVSLPFAAAVLDYQKHRIKKLKKQHGALYDG